MRDRGRWRWWYVVLAGILAVAVALALVRTTFLTFALLTLWFLIWSLRRKRWGPVVAASAAVAAAGSAVYAFLGTVVQRLVDLSDLSLGGSAELAAGGDAGLIDAGLRPCKHDA